MFRVNRISFMQAEAEGKNIAPIKLTTTYLGKYVAFPLNNTWEIHWVIKYLIKLYFMIASPV